MIIESLFERILVVAGSYAVLNECVRIFKSSYNKLRGV
jgi:hypothetical protein